jgi:endonuclease/exonuclease/phosphatase family metal-dependent hydrolase
MILSRVPWRAARAVVLSGEGGAEAVRVTLDLGGQPVEVVGAHLRWPVTPDSARARAASLAGLATLVRGLPHPVVVVGDLNLTPHDGAFGRLLSAAGLANAAARSGLLTTWPAATGPVARRLPGLQIDHCLVSQGILTEALTVGPWVGSDHRPVLARLSVPLGFNAPAADRSTSRP